MGIDESMLCADWGSDAGTDLQLGRFRIAVKFDRDGSTRTPSAETHRQQPFATLDTKSLHDPWLAIQVDVEIALRFVLD